MNIEFFKQRARTLRKNGESWHAEDLEFLLAEIERLQVENKDLKQNLASAMRPLSFDELFGLKGGAV